MKRTDVRVMVDDGLPHSPHRLDPLIAELAKALRALVRERKCDRIAESRVGFRHTPEAIARMSAVKRKRDAAARDIPPAMSAREARLLAEQMLAHSVRRP